MILCILLFHSSLILHPEICILQRKQRKRSCTDLNALEPEFAGDRITRILTTDFPQFFAIVTRIRQEVHAIGPEGGMVSSTVIPQVQAIFPEGALTKKIKVGLQVRKKKHQKKNESDHDESDSGYDDSSKGRKSKPNKLALFGQGLKRRFRRSRTDLDSSFSSKVEEHQQASSPGSSTGNEISLISSASAPKVETPNSEKSKKAQDFSKNQNRKNNRKAAAVADPKPVSGCWAELIRVTMPNLDLLTRVI